METNKILLGDALAMLKTLPDNHVQTIITSPPYYRLRDYGIEGQIGLETTPALYIEKLVEVFDEAWRVLRPDGTLWIDIGDTYVNEEAHAGQSMGKHVSPIYGSSSRPSRYTGMRPKNLLGIPWRLAFALQNDGWILRQDNIWWKTNPMPESVLDRPTCAHEHVFLLAKSERYFYDGDAVRQPLAPKTYTTYGIKYHEQGNDALGKVKSDNWGRTIDERQPRLNGEGEIAGASLRNVWPLASQPYAGAHFATMPPKLAELCLLAGTSPKACERCDTPWERVRVATGHINTREEAHAANNTPTKTDSTGWVPTHKATNQWEPGCQCKDNKGSGRCIALDPFCGAGTVPMIALKHHRAYIGIELNPAYIELIHKRIAEIQPVLWAV